MASAEVASPIKKRPRLSLKFFQKQKPSNPLADLTERKPSEPTDSKLPAITDTWTCENPVTKEMVACEEIQMQTRPPGVAGLENLGNTCFVNSVLQILRNTPGFLERLTPLSKDIISLEKSRKHSTGESPGSDKQAELSWDLTKSLCNLFNRMNKREEKWRENSQQSEINMAVKPDKVLENIRSLNPMFEGYLQHDAQELMRCLLCNIQDAERALNKRRPLKMSSLKSNNCNISSCMAANPIMASFLNKKIKNKCSKDSRNGTETSTMVTSPEAARTVRTNLFPQNDLLDSLDLDERLKQSDAANLPLDMEDMPSVAIGNDNADVPCDRTTATEKRSPIVEQKQRRSRGRPSKSEKKSPAAENSNFNNSNICKLSADNHTFEDCLRNASKQCSSDNGTITSTDFRSMSEMEMSSPIDDKTSSVSRDTRSKRRSLNKSATEVPPSGGEKKQKVNDTEVIAGPHQPTILTMFSKKDVSWKRLGMRGAIVQKSVKAENSPENENQSKMEVDPIHSDEYKWDNMVEITDAVKKSNYSGSPMNQENGFIKKERMSDIENYINETPEKKCISPRIKNLTNADESNSQFVTYTSPRRKKLSEVKNEVMTEENLKNTALEDIEHAVVKLEKCDALCGSPRESVSARRALATLSSPARMKKAQDIVEWLYQGTMMLRTRCLECESAKERREDFQDVSVPIKKIKDDSDDDKEKQDDSRCTSWLMSAFTEVERLRDDNKYFCDQCLTYVEAERSLHYEAMPEILTLHLKRFTSSGPGIFGCVSKINDHVDIPITLPCLRYKCPRNCCRNDHKYKLYGLITHAGVTITSGHYITYVRNLSRAPSTCATNKVPRRTSALTTSKPTTSKPVTSTRSRSTFSSPTVTNGNYAEEMFLGQCDPNNNSDQNNNGQCDDINQSVERIADHVTDYTNQWAECDDDAIRVFSEEEFEELLASERQLVGSPYVLFYHRILE